MLVMVDVYIDRLNRIFQCFDAIGNLSKHYFIVSLFLSE